MGTASGFTRKCDGVPVRRVLERRIRPSRQSDMLSLTNERSRCTYIAQENSRPSSRKQMFAGAAANTQGDICREAGRNPWIILSPLDTLVNSSLVQRHVGLSLCIGGTKARVKRDSLTFLHCCKGRVENLHHVV